MRGSAVKLLQRRGGGSKGRVREAKRKWLKLPHTRRGELRAQVREATAREKEQQA